LPACGKYLLYRMVTLRPDIWVHAHIFIEVPECQENEGPYISVNHNSYYSVTYIYGSQSN